MYIPSYFKINNHQELYDVMKENSFATLISQHDGKPFATHLPLILDDQQNFLYGHFAKPNPQWRDLENQLVLAIFHGPHCYISPSWYETNSAVPTWNYVTVHAYGQAEFISDEELMESFIQLISKYEGEGSDYSLAEVEKGDFEKLKKGVQGFKIKIHSLEGKAKLSQNHPVPRQEKVISELEKSSRENEREIAKRMKNNLGNPN